MANKYIEFAKNAYEKHKKKSNNNFPQFNYLLARLFENAISESEKKEDLESDFDDKLYVAINVLKTFQLANRLNYESSGFDKADIINDNEIWVPLDHGSILSKMYEDAFIAKKIDTNLLNEAIHEYISHAWLRDGMLDFLILDMLITMEIWGYYTDSISPKTLTRFLIFDIKKKFGPKCLKRAEKNNLIAMGKVLNILKTAHGVINPTFIMQALINSYKEGIFWPSQAYVIVGSRANLDSAAWYIGYREPKIIF
ncbi:hypothetical protein [Desulfuromonas thiophila]|uniref:hypothetical protein n=1 Tax=Desulfuromonas thiophila TaxID=57664 RepID=UPI0029F4B1AF|nr:hypothetical protein [Desulfuromonas thiophila]